MVTNEWEENQLNGTIVLILVVIYYGRKKVDGGKK
jgi:hypothetical protein